MTHSNDEQQHERLSAFLDDELTVAEQRQLAADLASDTDLQAQLTRYQRIGDAMRGADELAQIDASLIARQVSVALEDEPTILTPKRWRLPAVPRLALGGAMAAAVAMVAVGIAPQLLSVNEEPVQQETFAFSPKLSAPMLEATTVALRHEAATPMSNPALNDQQWKTLNPAMQKKLDRYLLEHNEYAGYARASGPASHIGFVSLHEERQ